MRMLQQKLAGLTWITWSTVRTHLRHKKESLSKLMSLRDDSLFLPWCPLQRAKTTLFISVRPAQTSASTCADQRCLWAQEKWRFLATEKNGAHLLKSAGSQRWVWSKEFQSKNLLPWTSKLEMSRKWLSVRRCTLGGSFFAYLSIFLIYAPV